MSLLINLPADALNVAEEAKWIYLGDDGGATFKIGDSLATLETIADGTATMVDVSAWEISFTVRKSDSTLDAALLHKTTTGGITITGTFGATAALSTQKVVVTWADTDVPAWDGTTGLKPKTYRYALKRTDAGSETTLAVGDFVLVESPER